MIDFEEYTPLDDEGNIEKAVRNLRKAYWIDEPELCARAFTAAEEIIISAIVHHDYMVVKEQEHE